MCKRKKFHIVLDAYKLADSDNDNVRDFNANECRKDGLKSKSIENARVRKGEGKLRHVLMVGAKLIEFAGNFTLRLSKAPGDLKDFSFISDIINEKLRECVFGFSFNGNNRNIIHHDGETMSIRSTLTQTTRASTRSHTCSFTRCLTSTRTARTSSLSTRPGLS